MTHFPCCFPCNFRYFLFEMPGKPKGRIWDHFIEGKRAGKTNVFAICKYCSAENIKGKFHDDM